MNVSRSYAWFRSLRWGRSQFGGVLWWICSPIGEYVIVDELKFQQLDAPELVAKIRAKDAELRMVSPCRYLAAEPKLWDIDTPDAPTLAEAFARAGMPLFKSSGDAIQGWNQLSALMNATVTDPKLYNDAPRPALVIAESCTQLRRLLPLLREGQGTGQYAREDIDSKTEAALAHALRIGVMSRPSSTFVAPPTPPKGSMGESLARARRDSRNTSRVSVII